MYDDYIFKREVSVGVILPCFNSSSTISRALSSICEQTVRVKCVYIYDDGSSDLNLLREKVRIYSKVLNIKFYSCEENYGPSASRNYFLGSTSVKYLAFLDSDDIWLKNKIEYQFRIMEERKANLTGHAYSPKLLNSNVDNNIEIKRLNVNNFLLGSPLFTPTIMIRNDNLRPFNFNFRTSEDWLFCMENIIINSWQNDCYFISSIMSGGFKEPLGVTGAGSSIAICHKDRLRALKHLQAVGLINNLQYFIAYIVEKIKFPLRYVKYFKMGL